MGLLGGAVGDLVVEDPEGCGGSGKIEPRLRLRGRGGRRTFGVVVVVPGMSQDGVGGGVPVLDVAGGSVTKGEDFGFGGEWVRRRVRGCEMLGRWRASSGVLCNAEGEARTADCVVSALLSSSSSAETRGNGMRFLCRGIMSGVTIRLPATEGAELNTASGGTLSPSVLVILAIFRRRSSRGSAGCGVACFISRLMANVGERGEVALIAERTPRDDRLRGALVLIGTGAERRRRRRGRESTFLLGNLTRTKLPSSEESEEMEELGDGVLSTSSRR